MYIALEGVDTAGKSTQLQRLKDFYREKAIYTFEPGNTEAGEHIREILLHKDFFLGNRAEVLLFLADRAEHMDKVIRPNSNKLIFSDRSMISGMAYATAFTYRELKELNSFATGGIFPNLAIILSLELRDLQERLAHIKQDKIEQKGLDFLMQIQERLIEVCEFLNIPYLICDASLDKEQITERIISFIAAYK